MAIIMRNGEVYASGGSSTTTRFVSDPNKENYGWIQYKDENGEWVNWEKAANGNVLFSANNNAAEFVATEEYSSFYYTDPSVVTVSDTLTLAPADGSHDAGNAYMMMSKKIDVTDFTKIIMEHTTTLPETSEASWAKIFVVDELTGIVPTRLTPLAENIYLINQQMTDATVELDISSVNGEVYIFVEMKTNLTGTTSSNCSCVISNMYLE